MINMSPLCCLSNIHMETLISFTMRCLNSRQTSGTHVISMWEGYTSSRWMLHKNHRLAVLLIVCSLSGALKSHP